MIVLGVDPGVANTGYGVVARRADRLVALDGGVIRTPAGAAPERRLADIHAQLAELIGCYEPDAMALEELYFGQNARTAFAVGHARGAAMLAAGQRGVPCSGYTPQQVKGAVCGSGRAPLRPHRTAGEDALALSGFHSEQERELFLMLISVQAVGPKVALAVLSGGPPRELTAAIAAGDAARFQAVPGIGKRTAERIIVELREKVAVDGAEEAFAPIAARRGGRVQGSDG